MTRSLILAVMLALAGAASQAQPVWRCGPDGRAYADAPCSDGRQVDVADPRDPARVSEAQADAARQRALARQLAAERRAREAEGRRSGAAPLTVPAAELSPRRTSRDADRAKKHKRSKRRPGAGSGSGRTAAHASPPAAD